MPCEFSTIVLLLVKLFDAGYEIVQLGGKEERRGEWVWSHSVRHIHKGLPRLARKQELSLNYETMPQHLVP